MSITMKIMTITPEMAASWLAEANTHNRAVRGPRVRQISDDICHGRWLQNGEAIKFSSEGLLLDGQHRLAAIVMAGVPVESLVIFGLEPNVQESMDTGATRTFGDVLMLRGETNYASLAATTRAAWEWVTFPKSRLQGHGGVQASHAQLSDILEKHPELREANILGLRAARGNPVLTASLAGLCAWLFAQIDQEDAEAFFEGLSTGANLSDENPILALRRTLRNYHERPSVVPNRRVIVAIVIKAWNTWRDGMTVRMLTFRPGGVTAERFPEPR